MLSVLRFKDYDYPFGTSKLFFNNARRLPLVKQEVSTLSGHMNSLPVFIGFRVARALVLCVVFCGPLFVLFSFFCWSL